LFFTFERSTRAPSFMGGDGHSGGVLVDWYLLVASPQNHDVGPVGAISVGPVGSGEVVGCVFAGVVGGEADGTWEAPLPGFDEHPAATEFDTAAHNNA
jgi:hypothetical protein